MNHQEIAQCIADMKRCVGWEDEDIQNLIITELIKEGASEHDAITMAKKALDDACFLIWPGEEG